MDTIKKIRRSISSSSTNIVQTTVPSGKMEKKQTWVHAPDVLLHGSVTYTLRLMGTRAVNKPKGTDVVREAIHAIKFHNETKRAETSHGGAKLQKVDLRINVEGVTILDAKSKELLYRYPLKRISFCSDDKQDKRYLAFIANDGDSSKSTCLVFLSDKMSEEITRTIGEAFDLCYKKFMDSHKLNLQNQKEVLLLRKRIAELEEENQRLSQLLSQATKHHQSRNFDSQPLFTLDAPALPTSPMPSGPPPSIQTNLPLPSQSTDSITPSGLLPPPSSLINPSPSTPSIAPPPIPVRRATLGSISPPSSIQSNSLFDDSFDPRSAPPTTIPPNGSKHKSAVEYDTLIHDLDAQLESLQTPGQTEEEFSLEVADAGDAFKELDDTNEYGCPRNIVDPKLGKKS